MLLFALDVGEGKPGTGLSVDTGSFILPNPTEI